MRRTSLWAAAAAVAILLSVLPGASSPARAESTGQLWTWCRDLDSGGGAEHGPGHLGGRRLLHSLVAVDVPSRPVRSHAVAWGWNGVGQVGDGTTTDRALPVRADPLENVHKVGAGAYHSLSVQHDGSVASWGWNAFGQLGDGSILNRHRPGARPLAAGALQVSGGAGHTLVTAR